jgi:hypothetical protein
MSRTAGRFRRGVRGVPAMLRRAAGPLMVAAVVVLIGVPVGAQEKLDAPAGSEQDEFNKLQARRIWTAFADARPYSPYVGIPGEFRAGAPFARSYIDSTPGRSECFAALFYFGEELEEVSQLSGYTNPFYVRTNYPDVGSGTEGEVAPLGPGGPHTRTKNPSRTECNSVAASGAGGDGAFLDGGFAKTSTSFNRDDLVVDEVVSRGQGVQIGDVKVGSFESFLKVEFRLGAEPVVSYRMTLAGVEAGGKQVVGVGDQGIVLSGENVVARDLIDQFNAQAAEHGKALEDKALAGSLALVQPKVAKDSDGGITVMTSVVEVKSNNQLRKNTVGDNLGVRLGLAEVYAVLDRLADPSELLIGLEPPSIESPPSDLIAPSESPALVSPLPAEASFSGDSGLAGGLSGGFSVGGLGAGPSADFGLGSEEALGIPAPPEASSASSPAFTTTPPGPSSLALAAPAATAKDLANGFLGGVLVLLTALVGVGALTLKNLA